MSIWLFASARRPRNRGRLWRVDIHRDGPTLGNQAQCGPVREFNHIPTARPLRSIPLMRSESFRVSRTRISLSPTVRKTLDMQVSPSPTSARVSDVFAKFHRCQGLRALCTKTTHLVEPSQPVVRYGCASLRGRSIAQPWTRQEWGPTTILKGVDAGFCVRRCALLHSRPLPAAPKTSFGFLSNR